MMKLKSFIENFIVITKTKAAKQGKTDYFAVTFQAEKEKEIQEGGLTNNSNVKPKIRLMDIFPLTPL